MGIDKLISKTVSLDDYGIENAKVRYNLSSDELHNICLENGCHLRTLH